MTAEQVLTELEKQVEAARAAVNKMFFQWDTSGIPSNSAMMKMTKPVLVELMESYRENPPSKGKKPKIGDAVHLILTDENLTLVPKDTICEIIREAFNSRDLKCDIKTLDWYPSAHAYYALPRRLIQKEVK